MEQQWLLIEALRAAMRGRQVTWNKNCDAAQWEELYQLAAAHRVQALVLEAVYTCPDFALAAGNLKIKWRQETAVCSAGQLTRDAAFFPLYSAMRDAGMHPLVMKGAVCRGLYPDGTLRPSSDEDLLVPQAEFGEALTFLQGRGMALLDPHADAQADFEIGLTSADGLYIELHKMPFSPESSAMEQCNRFFSDAHSRAVHVNGLLSMCPHDHMLYLLLHAYKHFIHSGFGLRQVCDIALWAENYADRIDWPLLWTQCAEVRSTKFAKTVFAAAREYLGFDPQKTNMELEDDLPTQALLEDLLDAGIFGSASHSRLHSATVTLNAVEADRRGEKRSLLRSVFPKRGDLEGRYPYLRRYPVLLPAAWCSRLVRYGLETGKQNDSPAQSLALGQKRTDLLRQLDMID